MLQVADVVDVAAARSLGEALAALAQGDRFVDLLFYSGLSARARDALLAFAERALAARAFHPSRAEELVP